MRIPFDIPERGERAFDVVGLGLNSIDLVAVVAEYPESNSKQPLQRFARLPGGETATAMAICARLGWDASYIGSFGDDEFGRTSAESLLTAGVSIEHARVVPGAVNQFAMILVDARSGDRTVLWDRDPKLTLKPDEVMREPSTAGRLLVVDSVQTAAATRAATYARAAGIPTILDIDKVRPGTQQLLRQIDVIIGAESLPSELTGYDEPGRAIAAMANEYASAVVCVTLGEKGCLARVGGMEIRVPAYTVPCVDTTGAGDAFRGGFAAGCLDCPDGDIEDVLAYANAVAALNCRGLGARGGMPTKGEVEALLVR
ncbi:MAG TPA: PfkB family carbohydrate kinase [Vicinamibacterales bacterium]|nr:PfkB family carbohydrate kinase [Vicinamibacterales bacterium]